MERLTKKIGRIIAAGGLFVATALGADSAPTYAGAGCNVPAKPGEECIDPPIYVTDRYKIEWIRGYYFRVESQTRFLGVLWETGNGTREGLETLQNRCGKLGFQGQEKKLFANSVRVYVSNPPEGCLIHQQVGGGGG